MSEEIHQVDNKAVAKERSQIEKNLKRLKKQYRRQSRYRTKANILTFVLIVCLILGGLTIGMFCYNEETASYKLETKEMYTNCEKEFAEAAIQSREKQIQSGIVSSKDIADTNDYIASLYRRSESRITPASFADESYYLLTDSSMWEKYNLSDTTNNAIYPGAILKGDSLFTGNYTVLEAERTPIELMSNQANGRPVTVSDPNYSNVTVALNQYANDYAGDFSKEWTYQLLSASTSQELGFQLGIDLKKFGFDIGGNKTNQQTTMAVVYSQIYYTVSTEPKNNAADYFDEGVDLKTLGEYEPAYVSSVDYGRKIILLVSGALSEEDLSAKLNACIKGVNIGVGIENIKKDETLECRVESYGGEDVSDILNAYEPSKGVVGELKEWLFGDEDGGSKSMGDRLTEKLSDGSQLVNPVPLSYNLKYLSDNAPVPVMHVNSEAVMFADGAQLVNLSSDGMFTIDITGLPAILLKVDGEDVFIRDTEVTGTSFLLLCSDCESLPVSISKNEVFPTFNKGVVSIIKNGLFESGDFDVDLAEYETETEIRVNSINIYKTKNLEKMQ